MDLKKISSIVEEIVFFEYLQKIAGSLVDIQKNKTQINDLFRDYIANKKFYSGGKQLKYIELDDKLKSKVWQQFWNEIGSRYKNFSQVLEETVNKFEKQPV